MHNQAVARTCPVPVNEVLPSASMAKEAIQPDGTNIFRLDVDPNDVAMMVRYRHTVRDDDTQIRVWAGVEAFGTVGSPADYVVDSVDVIGTRWDGQANGGMHRVVCLLERTPDERSAVRYLIVVDQGDAIAIPPVDTTNLRRLNDFRLVYSHGGVLLPP